MSNPRMVRTRLIVPNLVQANPLKKEETRVRSKGRQPVPSPRRRKQVISPSHPMGRAVSKRKAARAKILVLGQLIKALKEVVSPSRKGLAKTRLLLARMLVNFPSSPSLPDSVGKQGNKTSRRSRPASPLRKATKSRLSARTYSPATRLPRVSHLIQGINLAKALTASHLKVRKDSKAVDRRAAANRA